MATWNLVNADDPLLARTAINAASKDLCVNVKDYGAVGDGEHDDTDAIEAAFAVIPIEGINDGSIFFPPGQYVYNGDGLDPSYYAKIVGSGVGYTNILLGASSYLVDTNKVLNQVHLEGFTTTGGLGAYRQTYTGQNVVWHFVVKHCHFDDYTECAIASDAEDHPYWEISNCIFAGLNSTDTIGVALGGWTDISKITGCSFRQNRVDIKLGRGANNMYISNCELTSWDMVTTGGPRVAVWVVPNASIVNAGAGFTITSCKFGNEGLVIGDFRVAYADEDLGSGTTVGNKMPELGVDSTGYIVGHIITDNGFYGIGANTPPVVFSTTPNVIAGVIRDNYIAGANYLLEFLTPSTTADRLGDTNILGPNATYGNIEGSLIPTSNTPGVGVRPDPLGMASATDSVNAGAATSASYEDLLTVPIGSFSLPSARLTKDSDDTDAMGGTEAATFTATHASSSAVAACAVMRVGVPVWVEFDVKNPDDGNALDQFYVYVSNSSGAAIHWRRTVPVPTVAQGWVNYAFSFVPREVGSTYPQLFFSNADTGDLKSVSLGRVRMYHGKERQIGGKRPTVSSTAELHAELDSLGIINSSGLVAPVFQSLDFPSVSAHSHQDLTVAVVGAVTTPVPDAVVVGLQPGWAAATPGIVLTAHVSAADVVTVRAHNVTAGAINPAASSFTVALVR